MPFDAIVVGARVAGSTTALLLARKGHRVLMVDRAAFPSDTISTHIVWQRGMNCLMEWGVADRVQSTNAPVMDTVSLDFGPFALTGKPPAVGRAAQFVAPRRTHLDKILSDAAAESGVEVREGCTLEDLVVEDGVVRGIRARSKSQGTFAESASVVIGADGVHSTLARLVDAPEYNAKPRLACWYYSYWSGIASRNIRFYTRPEQAIGCIPTNDGLCCIPVAWLQRKFATVKEDIESHYLAALEMAPALRDDVQTARREERFYGTGDVPNFFRKPYGPGWALVGDAGYHKDPILAQGISDAFHQASLLSHAIDVALTGRATWEEALAGYESERNASVAAIYEMNAEFASLDPPPDETQQLLAALLGNQEDTNQFLGTMTGAVPIPAFFAPENVARIMNSSRQSAGAD